MVPADYRLDHVTARLIERLEGARPTYETDGDAMTTAFSEIAERHVSAAMAEYGEVALVDDPEPHAAFVRREVLQTMLPRYVRLAVEQGERESSGFGFGPLYEPVGRLGLVVVALLILWLALLRMMAWPVVWPLLLLDLSLPFWPSIAAWVSRRRYHARLTELVEDMTRIQDNEAAYVPVDQLRVEGDAADRARRARAAEQQHDEER